MKNSFYYRNKKAVSEVMEKRNAEYLDYVSERTGWSKEQAKAEMDKYLAQGVTYRYYVKKRIWSRDGKKLEASLKNIEKESRQEKRSLKRHGALVAKESGMSKGKAIGNILESNLYTECSPRDYYQFRFWEKTLEEQMTYYTKGTVERLIMKYNTDPNEVMLIRSKAKFAKKFGDLYNRRWFVSNKVPYDEFLEKVEGLDALIVKPSLGTHGEGVEKLSIPADEAGKRKLYEEIMEKPTSICEEVIVQHHEIAEFCPESVNTIRLVTIFDNDEVHYMYSVLRMGIGGLIDGASAGGVFAPIDVETGVVIMDAMKLDGTVMETHPVSGKVVKGFQVPNWDKVLKLADTAARRLEGARMIGWDIAVTEDGVSLIEGNSESNYQFAQLPYVSENKGMRYKFEKFL